MFDMSPLIKKLQENSRNLEDVLSKRTNTAKLWVQYVQYVNIIKEFARAERIWDWKGHLVAMEKMRNLFAATEHINYAKSATPYLQNMRKLETECSWLYQQFTKKVFHYVRETDKFWAELWIDMVIKQTMMRSLKSLGRLTRGWSIYENTRNLWFTTLWRS